MDRFFPDYVQIEVVRRNAFAFRLPATAFGISDKMLVEICVEYVKNADGVLVADAWAGQAGSTVRYYADSVHVPSAEKIKDREQAIIEALNQKPEFHEIMCSLLHELLHEAN